MLDGRGLAQSSVPVPIGHVGLLLPLWQSVVVIGVPMWVLFPNPEEKEETNRFGTSRQCWKGKS